MTPIDWIFGTLLVAAIFGAVRYRESNIRLENDKKLLTEQIGELAGKIADLTEDHTQAIKSLAENSEAKIKQKDSEVDILHKGIEFRRSKKTGDKWALFCPKCHLPAQFVLLQGRRDRRAVACTSQCGWSVFVSQTVTLEDLVSELSI